MTDNEPTTSEATTDKDATSMTATTTRTRKPEAADPLAGLRERLEQAQREYDQAATAQAESAAQLADAEDRRAALLDGRVRDATNDDFTQAAATVERLASEQAFRAALVQQAFRTRAEARGSLAAAEIRAKHADYTETWGDQNESESLPLPDLCRRIVKRTEEYNALIRETIDTARREGVDRYADGAPHQQGHTYDCGDIATCQTLTARWVEIDGKRYGTMSVDDALTRAIGTALASADCSAKGLKVHYRPKPTAEELAIAQAERAARKAQDDADRERLEAAQAAEDRRRARALTERKPTYRHPSIAY